MTPSADCIELIQYWESLRLTAYADSAGVWTIGWGHTRGVKHGDVITVPVAWQHLQSDCASASELINEHFGDKRMTQGQFDALTSFAFNVGPGKKGVKDGLIWLKSGKRSTLYRHLRNGDMNAAAGQFKFWVNALNPKTGKLEPLLGLKRRRAAERALFEGLDWRKALEDFDAGGEKRS